MQNPIFFILIVTRKRDNSSDSVKELSNGGGTSDKKSSNDPRISFKNSKYTYNLNHETPDTGGPKDEDI